jgi:asparagine synthase (glutamine-hydrolysing)
MCGIVGIASIEVPVDEQEVLRMRDIFPYRGPDDAGVWLDADACVGFGHRRLSILDPTPAGHQPMVDTASGCCICFNGEIYNYIEIRNELAGRGYEFHTHSDTEVILKAWLEYGKECLKHFNGMFAFALWDPRRREVFLARDRLGKKPLYFQVDARGRLIFASEVKALLVSAHFRGEIDHAQLDHYMSFGYLPGGNTLHRHVKRLLPAHWAVWKEGELTTGRYWQLNFEQSTDLGFDHYLERSKSLLNDAIDLRLRSDVPLGIFLSGGIDSSAVVGLLAARVANPLKTFSVAYDFGAAFDETRYARIVADKFATEHQVITMQPQDFRDFVPDYVRLMDEPVTESAAISLYFVSKLAKNDVTVVLSGEGSDEIFAGYDLYRYMRTIEALRSALTPGAASLLGNTFAALLGRGKLAKYLRMTAQPFEQRYKGISVYEEFHKDLLYRPELKALLAEGVKADATRHFLNDLFQKTQGLDSLSRMLHFDTHTWLVDDLLIKADRMSMAASLELRVPFLDYRLVEFAATIPSKYKIHRGEGKYLLKKMLEDILPDEIIYRKKMGFPTPLKRMFETDLRDYASDLLLSPAAQLAGLFERDRMRQLLEEHQQQRHDHHRILWQLVVLEQWLRLNKVGAGGTA